MIKTKTIKQQQKPQQTLEKTKNLILRVATLFNLMSSFKFKKITRQRKKQECLWPIQRKNKLTKTIPEKGLMTDLLDKDLKIIVLKCSKC